MKKILIINLILVLMFPNITLKTNASELKKYAYSQNENYSTSAFSSNEEFSSTINGTVFTTDKGLLIKNNDNEHIITTAFPVLDYKVVEDIDNDGIKDILTLQKTPDNKGQVVMISTNSSKVIYEKLFTYKDSENNLKNSNVMKMFYHQNNLYIIYDYHLVGLDLMTGKEIFDYEDQNNIWDAAIIEDKIAFTNQMGQVTLIDQNGKKQWQKQIASSLPVTSKENNKTYSLQLNTWDIEVINDKIYVTSEDGVLTILKSNGEIENTIDLEIINKDALAKSLSTHTGYDLNYRLQLIQTGIVHRGFMNVKIEQIYSNYLIISAYLGHQNGNINDETLASEIKPSLVILDLNTNTIVSTIKLEQYNLDYSNVILSNYENKEVLIVPTNTTEGIIRFNIYELENGNLLTVKTLNIPIIKANNEKIKLMQLDEGYLLQSLNNVTLKTDLNTVTYINEFAYQKEIEDLGNELLVENITNGICTNIQKINTLTKEVIYDVALSDQLKDTSDGFENIVYKDNQILALVHEKDQTGQKVASYIYVINALTGQILNEKPIKIGETIKENKKVNVYLVATSIQLTGDLNKDGYREILVDEAILDGKTYSLKSVFMPSVTDTGLNLNVGDVNLDGVDDLVAVNEQEAVLYHSKINGYEISYTKTNQKIEYAKELLNHQYAKVLPDMDNDGINDIVLNAKNESGYQVYQVIDTKTFAVKYTLLKDGFSHGKFSFAVNNEDLNNDGTKELIFQSTYGWQQVIDGKTGEVLFEKHTTPIYGEYYRPEPTKDMPINEFILDENVNEVVKINYNNQEAVIWYQSDYSNKDYRENTYLCIYNLETKEMIKKIKLTLDKSNNSLLEDYNVILVENSNNCIYKANGQSVLFDFENNAVLAKYNLDIKQAKQITDQYIKTVSSQNNLYLLDQNVDFTLTNVVNQQILSGVYTFKWDSNSNGVMEILIDGNHVVTSANNEATVKLLKGKHTITFAYDDGFGKKVNENIEVTVKKSNALKIIVVLIGISALIGLFVLSSYPKYKLKKKVGELHG